MDKQYQLWYKEKSLGGTGEVYKTGTFAECLDYQRRIYEANNMDLLGWFRILPKKTKNLLICANLCNLW